ncbi:major facilitator superfamily domain-containing protein [Sporodiniella umbellata]|nr:major facilitator superfamily domain-containing protein [Sporodiniella umbellata]
MSPTTIFVVALLVANASGAHYVFPTVWPALASRFQWSPVENSIVSTAVFVGVSFSGPWCAWQVGNLGAKKTLLISSTVLLLVSFLLAETLTGRLWNNYLLCAFYLGCIGSASASSYMCAMDSQSRNFKSYQGLCLGLTSAALGMSGFVFSQINDTFFSYNGGDSTYYFLVFYGCTTSAISFLGSFVLGDALESHPFLIYQKTTNYDSISNITNIPNQSGEYLGCDSSLLEDSIEIEDDCQPTSTGFWNLTGFSLCFSLLVLLGIGYVYLTNIEILLVSLSPSQTSLDEIRHLRNVHISVFSVSNCISRIAFGILSDILQIRAGVQRIWFFWFTALGLTVNLISLIHFVPDGNHLLIYTVVTAIFYGNAFGIAPVIVSEMVPQVN